MIISKQLPEHDRYTPDASFAFRFAWCFFRLASNQIVNVNKVRGIAMARKIQKLFASCILRSPW